MKTKIFILLAILSVVLFLDYLFLTIIGCAANVCGANDCFYCNVFCKLVLIVVVASTILPLGIAAYKTYKQNLQNKE